MPAWSAEGLALAEMKGAGWIAAGTWPAFVDALIGRGRRPRDSQASDQLARSAAEDLLAQAVAALVRPCNAQLRTGFTERELTAAAGVDLLIIARDGDRARLGPHSLGRHTSFFPDQAPCTVALVWPGEAPGLDSIPAPTRAR